MKQENIFRYVGSAGLEGGFMAGIRLPKEKGSLKDFKIMRMSAIEGENVDKFCSRLIKKIGDTPKKRLEMRARQLKSLIEEATSKGKLFIVVINKAHLLHHWTLACLKGVHEFGENERTYPGREFS